MARIAVVTGASSGMGRLFALLLSEKLGMISELWIIARREERLSALSEQIRKRRKDLSVRCIGADLRDPAFFEQFSGLLTAERPEILFLVNAAGFGKIGSVEQQAEAVLSDMIRLDCEALVRMTRLCLPFLKNGAGRVINFASAAAFLPQPEFAVYAAAKAFVLSFSEAINEELRGRRISVTAVCPGPVRTEFFGIAEEFCALPLYKRLLMADAAAVSKKALNDSLARRPVSVYGCSMKGFRILAGSMPHAFLFFCMRLLNRKSAGKSEPEICRTK